MSETELLLIAKALRLEACKFAGLEKAMEKINPELYAEYIIQFNIKKDSISDILNGLDNRLNELSQAN